MKARLQRIRDNVGLLELLLALAFVLLVMQFFPSIGRVLLFTIDIRNWPKSIWFIGNVAIFFILIAIRFAPQLLEDWRLRKDRLASELSKKNKQQELKEQRENLERLKQAQRRRIY